MATSRTKYQIEVYDITPASGYKSASSAITPTDVNNNAVTLTDTHCTNYFDANKYPDPLPATDGTDALTAEDLSAVFAKKTFSDVDAAKSAIISSDLATAIAANCESIAYTLSSNNLILDCYHADSTKSAAMATAMNASGWSSEAGAVYSTIS